MHVTLANKLLFVDRSFKLSTYGSAGHNLNVTQTFYGHAGCVYDIFLSLPEDGLTRSICGKF